MKPLSRVQKPVASRRTMDERVEDELALHRLIWIGCNAAQRRARKATIGFSDYLDAVLGAPPTLKWYSTPEYERLANLRARLRALIKAERHRAGGQQAGKKRSTCRVEMINAVFAAREAVEATGKKATAKRVRSASKTLRLYKPDTVRKVLTSMKKKAARS